MTILDDDVARDLAGGFEPRRHAPGRRVWLAVAGVAGVLLVVLAVAIGGGSGSRTNRGAAGGTTADTAGSTATSAAGGQAVIAGPAPATPDVPAATDVSVDKVVKTGEVDLQVARGQVPHTLDRLIALATLERGFVAESHSDEGDVPSGSVTLRVPVQSFDATLGQVRRLPGKVVSQQSAAADVTSDYVDLRARLRSLTATRAAFERLLARATSIGDTLAVQSRITGVQTQIEQLQGRLRVLDDQATFATLTATVGEVGTKAVVTHRSAGMSRALHRSWDRFVTGVEAIVGVIGPLVLVAMLAAVAWLLARVVRHRLRRRTV